jgi:hypothetical protein
MRTFWVGTFDEYDKIQQNRRMRFIEMRYNIKFHTYGKL